MHGYGSARAEIARSDIFSGESKSGRPHLMGFGTDDGDDFGYADGSESVIGGKLLMGVMGLHPRSRRWRKMLVPALTG